MAGSDINENPESSAKHKDEDKMGASQESFKTPVMGAKDAEKADPVYKQLIDLSKKRIEIPGALYIASVTIPLEKPNANHIVVGPSDISQNFLDSFVQPYPIPILHGHLETSEGPFDTGRPAQVYGRVTAAMVDSVKAGNRRMKAVVTGQVITEQNTIERIMSMTDYTQSITWLAEAKNCTICNAAAPFCEHIRGNVYPVLDKNGDPTGKEELALERHRPKRAIEESFVLVPAYEDAMIKAIEKNSVGADPHLVDDNVPQALFAYSKKVTSNGVDLPKDPLKAEKTEEGSQSEENNVTMENNNPAFEGIEMNKEELQELFASSMEPVMKKLGSLEERINSIESSKKGDEGKDTKNSETENKTEPADAGEGGSDAPAEPNTASNDDQVSFEEVKEFVHKMGLILVKQEENREKQLNTLIEKIDELFKQLDEGESSDTDTEEEGKDGDGESSSTDEGSSDTPDSETEESETDEGKEASDQTKDEGEQSSTPDGTQESAAPESKKTHKNTLAEQSFNSIMRSLTVGTAN